MAKQAERIHGRQGDRQYSSNRNKKGNKNERRWQAVKTIGMIGGMSWESSAEYCRLANEEVRSRLGGLHSAKSILCSTMC